MLLRIFALLFITSLTVGACATKDTASESVAETDDALTGKGDDAPLVSRTYSNVTLLWQGDWDFLIRCDSYSKSQGHVVFFCDDSPSRSFVDEGAWLAMPRASFTRRQCGRRARVCKGDQCITATIIERSVTSTRWEGSTAVLRALGVEPGFHSCSNSFGTARGVTITLE